MFRLFSRKRIKQYTIAAAQYLKENYLSPVQYSLPPFSFEPARPKKKENSVSQESYNSDEVDRILKQASASENNVSIQKSLDRVMNASFVEELRRFIRKKGLKDPEVYKAAQMDRRLFSKIISDPQYQPSKDTAIALGLALRLTQDEAEKLLNSAGFSLSHSVKRDVIIEYFFRAGIYNVTDINITLHQMGQKKIGR